LKPNVDAALPSTPPVTDVVVVQRCGNEVDMVEGRDHWWHDVVPAAAAECAPESMDAEDLVFLLYTSGTTAKPKGIMHTTGGYLTQVAFTHKYVFDLKPDEDVYWCAADIGWVTGHSYIVYGPLTNGGTGVIDEGTPDTPGRDRLWSIIEKYGVTQLYTAPTAIGMFKRRMLRDVAEGRVLGEPPPWLTPASSPSSSAGRASRPRKTDDPAPVPTAFSGDRPFSTGVRPQQRAQSKSCFSAGASKPKQHGTN